MVPEGWKIKALSDIAAVERGKFSVRPRNDPQYYGGAIPFIQTGDVATSDGRITSYSQTLNERGLAVSRLFPKGTIFITIAANIGNAAIAEFDTACPDSIVAVQPTDDTSVMWLLHVLLLEQPKLDAYASQNAQKNINLETLRPLPILTPPNEEQHRIAAILSTWDTAITQMEKLCEAKRKLKKGLMQQCLTGKRRFPEFGTARQRTQWHFYAYPSEWAHPQLKEIASEVTVRNASGAVRTVLSCSKYVGFVNSLEYFGKQVYSDDISHYKIVQRGQFAYPANHIEEGSIGLLDHIDCGIVSPIYVVFRTDPHKVFSPYLYALFKTETYRHIFAMATNASVDRRGSLRWKEFSSIRVPLPSLDEQRRITAVLDAADREIKTLLRQLGEYRNQKRGLMQKLLTGQIRVKATEEITAP